MTRHDEVAGLLGALALGALDEAEEQRAHRHLAGCEACRAELAELSGVVGLLGRLGAAEAADQALLPREGFEDDVVAAWAEQRRRESSRSRRLQVALAAAAAVAVLVGGVATATGLARQAPQGPTVEAVAVRTAGGVAATAGVVAHTWGVEIVLTATGFEAGKAYAVEIYSRDGRIRSAGEFVGTGARPMVCNLNSSVLRGDATAFRVRDSAGNEALRGTLA